MRLGIFTKPCHVEKIVNYLNQNTDLKYIITTERREVDLYDYDVGISYCWPWLITDPLLSSKPWYNYHPGLLPFCKGVDCYTNAMLQGRYGVTLHKMDAGFDTGPVLRSVVYHADPVNSQDLANLAHYYLFRLFADTVEDIASGELVS